MLKNKKAIYILIPLNVMIWGFFAYRFYSAFSQEEIPESAQVAHALKTVELKDSIAYVLKMDYKDPFLKESPAELQLSSGNYRSAAEPVAKRPALIVKVPVVAKQLPDIRYLGLIKNNTSGLSTALISVNGQSKLIRQNESMDGIVFKSFNKDSLVAKWGKERIVARK